MESQQQWGVAPVLISVELGWQVLGPAGRVRDCPALDQAQTGCAPTIYGLLFSWKPSVCIMIDSFSKQNTDTTAAIRPRFLQHGEHGGGGSAVFFLAGQRTRSHVQGTDGVNINLAT